MNNIQQTSHHTEFDWAYTKLIECNYIYTCDVCLILGILEFQNPWIAEKGFSRNNQLQVQCSLETIV